MSNLTKDTILGIIKSITLNKDEKIFNNDLIEDILIKENEVQILISTTRENYKILENVGKKIEAALKKSFKNIDIITIFTNHIENNEKDENDNLEKIKNIIAIASGKGGVGKSTLAVNLAYSLSKLNLKVGLLDADIHGPSIPHMLNLSGKPGLNEEKKIIPFNYKDIKVMSIGFLLNEDQPVIWRGPMVHSAIKQMATETDWGELDILIIDMPPGTGDAQITVSQHLPLNGTIIVSTPQPVALNDAVKAIGMFRKVDIPIIGIIENMSYLLLEDGKKEDIFGKDGAKNMSEKEKILFIEEIPLDKEIRESSDRGVPYIFEKKDGLTKDIFLKAAKKIDKII